MKSNYKKRAIVLINEETGERKDFDSINGAAAFVGVNFFNLQRAAMYNGTLKGWRVYESASTIRKHIEELKDQLKALEK